VHLGIARPRAHDYHDIPALPGPRECEIQYTLSNAGGTSTASEVFEVLTPV
jgi:hypothetical protein